jgi:hypothetical protein
MTSLSSVQAAARNQVPPRRVALAMLQLLGPEGPVVAACLSSETRRMLAGAAGLVHLDDPEVQSAFTALLDEVRRPSIAPLTDSDVSALIAEDGKAVTVKGAAETSLSIQTLRRLIPVLPPELGAELLRQAPNDAALELLKELPKEAAASLLLAIAANRRLPKLQRELLQRVVRRIDANAGSSEDTASLKRVARLIGSMGDSGETVLAAIGEADAECATAISDLRLRLVDVPRRLDEGGMREVLRRCNRDDLLLALRLLRTQDEEAFEVLLSMQSKRLSQQMREELELMPPQSRKALNEAQDRVLGQVLQMIDQGEITLLDPDTADSEAGGGDVL